MSITWFTGSHFLLQRLVVSLSDSPSYIFGDSLGDPMADEILQELRASPKGLTRDEIRQLVGKNVASDRIGTALGVLVEYNLVRLAKEATAGRPVERWFAVSGDGRKGR